MDARQEEIGTPTHSDEWRRTFEVKVYRPPLNRNQAPIIDVADRVRPCVKTAKMWIVEPCILDHLELPGNIGIERDEQHSPGFVHFLGTSGLPLISIRSTAPDDPMHL